MLRRFAITKRVEDLPVPPQLVDYAAARAGFSWAAERAALSGLPAGGLNIAHEAVDRHAAGDRRDHVALRFIDAREQRFDVTYGALARASSRFAHALAGLGVQPGDRVFALLPRMPELHVAALGTWKARAVFCPLFAAFGPEPLRARLSRGDARVLVTTAALYERKVAALRALLPRLAHVFVIGGGAPESDVVLRWDEALRGLAADFTIAATDPAEIALLHFTSGTTGEPKGALHAHEAVVAHRATARLALDLQPEDVYWCTADPGWVTGLSYGVIAPLVIGATSIVDGADFDAARWLRILAREQVSVWYTAPTAIRMMIRTGTAPKAGGRPKALRFIASVGEPLDAQSVCWGIEAFGLPIHDNWWQTETGGIMIANFAAMDIRPGSMGRALPGIDAAIVELGADRAVRVLEDADAEGELALRTPWPSLFRGYLDDPARTARCYADGWYLSGDRARRDADGYFWFVARQDDVIKTSGHMVGPFEVESVLKEHAAVAEAGVIGVPDPIAGELVKAFVSLRAGIEAGDALRRELLAHARARLGAAIAPKDIFFTDCLPTTPSGKIMRRVLKARALGSAQQGAVPDPAAAWPQPATDGKKELS
jgi:acetyl-CoA synthetase